MAKIDDILQRYDTALQGAEDATIARVSRALDAAYRELETDILNAYKNHQGRTDLLPAQRKLLILSELGTERALLNPQEQSRIQQEMQQLLTSAYDSGVNLADEMSRAIANDALEPFSAVPLEAIRLQAQESAKRLYRHSEEMISRISGLVEINLATGKGPRVLATQLREQLGIMKGRAETIARTETLSAVNDAAQARYKRNGTEYVQWMASKGDVCPYCVARHGNVYKVGEVRLPTHPRCRCIWLPYRKEWAEDGLIDEQLFIDGKAERIAELEKAGQRVNPGLTPFERAAGLKTPPTPIWMTSNGPTPRIEPKPIEPPKPAKQRRTSSAPTKMRSDHTIATTQRWRGSAVDQGLDALTNEGAAERVAQFREFTRKQDIQAIFYDTSKPWSEQRSIITQKLKKQNRFWTESQLKDHAGHDRLGGYTWRSDNHVVVGVNYRDADAARRKFQLDQDSLNDSVRRVLNFNEDGETTPWSLVSVTEAGTDTHDMLVYLHEMGHRVHFSAGAPMTPANIGVTMSEYANANEMEFFAEHFAMWMVDAKRVREASPEIADYIEATFNAALSAK